MIGLDTSVIVRYLIGTPVDQAARAKTLIDGDRELGVSVVALVETAHVLRTQYDVPRAVLVDTLIDLITHENVMPLELSKADVLEALVAARSFPSAPIPDALIVAASRSGGAVPVYTFDRHLGRLGAQVASP